MRWDERLSEVPGECICHAAARRHDAYCGEDQADERESDTRVSVDILVCLGCCEGLHKQTNRPSFTSSGIVEDR